MSPSTSPAPQAPTSQPVWHGFYLALWALWAGFAVALAYNGGRGHRWWWWILIGVFFALEGIGAIAKRDGLPMLTEVFGRYVPGAVLFPVLALACWRLMWWVPGYIVIPFGAWQIWHFISTYHSYSRLGKGGSS